MKKSITLFWLAVFLFVVQAPLSAVVGGKAEAAAKEVNAQLTDKQRRRLDRKLERFERKMERKLEKRQAQGKSAPDVWDDGKFRLGVLLLVGALGLGILGALLNFGLFSFIAGLFALAGVILVIWSLVESYS